MNFKKIFIIINIFIKILLITYIYYFPNLFLNPKTFDIWLSLSLSILSLWSNGMNHRCLSCGHDYESMKSEFSFSLLTRDVHGTKKKLF